MTKNLKNCKTNNVLKRLFLLLTFGFIFASTKAQNEDYILSRGTYSNKLPNKSSIFALENNRFYTYFLRQTLFNAINNFESLPKYEKSYIGDMDIDLLKKEVTLKEQKYQIMGNILFTQSQKDKRWWKCEAVLKHIKPLIEKQDFFNKPIVIRLFSPQENISYLTPIRKIRFDVIDPPHKITAPANFKIEKPKPQKRFGVTVRHFFFNPLGNDEKFKIGISFNTFFENGTESQLSEDISQLLPEYFLQFEIPYKVSLGFFIPTGKHFFLGFSFVGNVIRTIKSPQTTFTNKFLFKTNYDSHIENDGSDLFQDERTINYTWPGISFSFGTYRKLINPEISLGIILADTKLRLGNYFEGEKRNLNISSKKVHIAGGVSIGKGVLRLTLLLKNYHLFNSISVDNEMKDNFSNSGFGFGTGIKILIL